MSAVRSPIKVTENRAHLSFRAGGIRSLNKMDLTIIIITSYSDLQLIIMRVGIFLI